MNAREKQRRAQGKRSIVVVVSDRIHKHYFGRDGVTAQSYINEVLEREIDRAELERLRAWGAQ